MTVGRSSANCGRGDYLPLKGQFCCYAAETFED